MPVSRAQARNHIGLDHWPEEDIDGARSRPGCRTRLVVPEMYLEAEAEKDPTRGRQLLDP